MAITNAFVARNGIISLSDEQITGSLFVSGTLVQITGSLNVLGGITGSLQGTITSASYALTASYVANASSFPYTGSAQISGSLAVNGPSTFTGTTASDGGQLGAELLTSSGWTSTGWTGSYPSFTHTTGNTTALTNTLAAVNGNNYAITYTITGRTAGSVTISFGGIQFNGATASGVGYGKATTTTNPAFYPTTDFDGTLTISVKQVTAGSATTTFQNSSATANIEVRASGASPTNTFIGLSSGRFSIGSLSFQNTSLGYNALASILSANNNTAIGYNAGNLITTGGGNTLIGSNAGQNITAAGNSTIIGVNAGQNITTASGTTIVGGGAGTVITSNSNNTLIGQNAGNNISGASNTALGFQALNGSGGSGNNNIAIGSQAGLNIFSGITNVLIGNSAGGYLTSGYNNVIIGHSAGTFLLPQTAGTTLTTNNSSVFVGISIRSAAQGASNEVVIAGYNNTLGQVGYGSNTTVIGNNLTTNTAIQGNLTLGSLNPVSIGLPVATPSTSGGTLAAGTYFYQIVAVDIYGNTTTPSAEANATTTGTTSSIALSWNAVTGSASYRVYRGIATNAQNVYYTSSTNSFTDINGTSTAGTVPTSNTTYLSRINSAGGQTINGSSIFQNATTSSDGGVLGPELTTASGWVSGSDWTGVYNSFTHISGSTATTLTSSLNAVVGNLYNLVFTVTGRNSGSYSATFGGNSVSGQTGTNSGLVGRYATTTALLYVFPTTDFDGTISVSVKQVLTGSALMSLQNSSGTANIEVRASGVSTTNTLIGLSSGRYLVSGTGNTSLGYGTLAVMGAGINNTAIGYNALTNAQAQSNLPATNNTAVGSGAGAALTIASNNTLVGTNAGTAITTGINNTTVGSGAGQAITTGNNNLLIGLSAGAAITTGASNTLIGYQAGNTILTGNANNTAVGSSALSGLTIGGFNVGIGANTGRALGTGGSTTLLGYNAGYNLANVNNNIAIGYSAGYYAGSGTTTNVTASNSLYLGYDVRASANGDTNEVVIAGYNGTQGAIGLGSNTTVIGNNATTVTGLYGNLVLGGNLITGSATGSGYTLNIAGPSTSGSLYSNGFSVFDGTISGSQPANNPSSSLILVSGSFYAAGSRTSAVYIAPYLTATGSTQILEAVNINPSFSGSTAAKVALRISTGNLIIGSNNDGGSRALYVGGYIETPIGVLATAIGANSIGPYTGNSVSIAATNLNLTGSNINLSGSVNLSGSLTVSQNITTTGTLTAQTLVVQTITSSVEYSSGSNIFGNSTANTQQFTGSVLITGSLTLTGNQVITGSITATAGGFDSDLTLKNIVSRDLSLYNIANEVSPIIYTWKDETRGTTPRFGYGAQELQTLIPEAVYQNGGTLAVDYTQVHTVLIDENTKRIQELEKQVTELKRLINELGSTIK